MRSTNTIRVISLALLLCAASKLVAAPAPISYLGASESAIKRLERQLEVRNKVQIDMQNQLASLLEEIDELRGVVEKNNYDLRIINQRQKQLYKEIDELRQNKTVASSASTNASSAVYSGNATENVEYNAAVDLILKKKDYAGAMRSFDSFIRKYPKSVYAPNVYYWLGQLHLTKGELNVAKKHFTQVINYQNSNKKVEALLKLGIIASRQNDSATATKFYRQILAEFPNTASASEAQQLLKK